MITVFIPTYNRAHLLPRAINSVLNQTYKNFELIIVDDGSTDNTEEVVKSFSDNRIIYHKHKENRGVLAARNTGWDLTKGKYYCALGDDDELLPHALETIVSKFNELSSEGVRILRFDIIDAETGKFSGSGIRKEGYVPYEDMLCGRIYGDYMQTIAMELVGDKRFDERLRGVEGILWLELHRKTKVYYLPQVLYKAYREHGERMSRGINIFEDISKIILTKKTYLEKYGEEQKNLCPKVYGHYLGRLGFLQILDGKKIEGRKTILKSLRFNFSIKNYILFLISFIINSNQIKNCYLKILAK